MLKIRLRRMGSRHRPFYRIVVSDSRRTPAASALEEIGHYDPRQDPVALSVDVARADHWMSIGAKPSETVGKILEKARIAAAEPAAAGESATGKKAAAKPQAEAKAEEKPAAEEAKAEEEPAAEEAKAEEEPAADETPAEEKAAAEASK